jgi:hypothetical protein
VHKRTIAQPLAPIMKTLLKLLIIVGAVLSGYNSYACICGREAREWSIETVKLNIDRSDLIFIGNLVNTEGNKYSFEVVEVFKGEIASDTIHGEALDGCSITPYIDGLWVIYTHMDERGMFDLTFCNLSRSLITLSPGLPPPGIEKAGEKYNTSWSGKELPVALQDWMQEYAMLVSLKKEQVESESQEKTVVEENNVSSSGLLTYVAIVLALVALLVALLKK